MKGRVFLIQWDGEEARERAGELRAAGWEVDLEAEDGARASRHIKADPPDAVVIDLTRLPSHGRETAHHLRALKATRHLPILFVGGSEEAVARVQAKVPGAAFIAAAELTAALRPYERTERRD